MVSDALLPQWKVQRLIAACEAALAHVQELEEAWRRGAITEHDGKGGTRSNRNVDVRAILADAISGKEVYDHDDVVPTP